MRGRRSIDIGMQGFGQSDFPSLFPPLADCTALKHTRHHKPGAEVWDNFDMFPLLVADLLGREG